MARHSHSRLIKSSMRIIQTDHTRWKKNDSPDVSHTVQAQKLTIEERVSGFPLFCTCCQNDGVPEASAWLVALLILGVGLCGDVRELE